MWYYISGICYEKDIILSYALLTCSDKWDWRKERVKDLKWKVQKEEIGLDAVKLKELEVFQRGVFQLYLWDLIAEKKVNKNKLEGN